MGALDRLGRDRRSYVVGLVLSPCLEWQQPAEVPLDLRAVGTRLSEKDEDLVVILTCGPVTETGAAHRVG